MSWATSPRSVLPLHQLVLLWTGSFACLLKGATAAQEKARLDVVANLSRFGEDVNMSPGDPCEGLRSHQCLLNTFLGRSAEFLVRGDLPSALPQQRLCQAHRNW